MHETDAKIARALGQAIRAHRNARGWSQAELAERLDLSTDFIGLLERGERTPALGTLVALARVLDASLSDLVSGSVVPKPASWEVEAVRCLGDMPGDLRTTMLKTLEAAAKASRSQARSRKAKRLRGTKKVS